jgi:hypothetical protein
MSLKRAACVMTAAEASIAVATLLIPGGVDLLLGCSLHVSIAVLYAKTSYSKERVELFWVPENN